MALIRLDNNREEKLVHEGPIDIESSSKRQKLMEQNGMCNIVKLHEQGRRLLKALNLMRFRNN
jgi:hypothetical protein